jgi:hypothetical protein
MSHVSRDSSIEYGHDGGTQNHPVIRNKQAHRPARTPNDKLTKRKALANSVDLHRRVRDFRTSGMLTPDRRNQFGITLHFVQEHMRTKRLSQSLCFIVVHRFLRIFALVRHSLAPDTRARGNLIENLIFSCLHQCLHKRFTCETSDQSCVRGLFHWDLPTPFNRCLQIHPVGKSPARLADPNTVMQVLLFT